MDADARFYQDELHKANTARMDRIEKKLDRTLLVMAEVAVAVKCIPTIEERLEDLESERDQRKGAMALFTFMCGLSGLIGGSLGGVIRHWLFGK